MPYSLVRLATSLGLNFNPPAPAVPEELPDLVTDPELDPSEDADLTVPGRLATLDRESSRDSGTFIA